jgi:hypothetical protein
MGRALMVVMLRFKIQNIVEQPVFAGCFRNGGLYEDGGRQERPPHGYRCLVICSVTQSVTAAETPEERSGAPSSTAATKSWMHG